MNVEPVIKISTLIQSAESPLHLNELISLRGELQVSSVPIMFWLLPSSQPSQAVQSLCYFPLRENRRHFRPLSATATGRLRRWIDYGFPLRLANVG
jgi:hypothetical protein